MNIRSARTISGMLLAGSLLAGPRLNAANVRIEIEAPEYPGERVLLHRYMDPFTMRTELIGQATIDAQGLATIDAKVDGTMKGTIRIGAVNADLWLRAGVYHVEFPLPAPGTPRSLNGTTEVTLLFKDLDRSDVNALMSDLNQRLDGFLAKDLATDRRTGMQAVDIARKDPDRRTSDTTRRPGTLFITPNWSAERVDSFETRLRAYYRDVDDPWFMQNLGYGIAGLRFGPRVNDRDLFERYLKGRPVLYDVPEYTRFLTSFFEGHLLRHPFRTDETALTAAVRSADTDSTKRIFARNDFLKDDRLCELVMLCELYGQYHGSLLDRSGIRSIIAQLAKGSSYAEHRIIATDMLWDLTTMRTGGTLPPLVLEDATGDQVQLDSVLHDATCLVVTAGWCTYCEQELVALESLWKEYGAYFHVVAISLDRDVGGMEAQIRAHPSRDWPWYFGGDDPLLMERLRIRTVPAFFLLNDSTLAYSPAPPPSNGMAAILHRMKVHADEENKLRPDQGPPVPRR